MPCDISPSRPMKADVMVDFGYSLETKPVISFSLMMLKPETRI